MISKLSLVAFALTFICISAKPSNPGARLRQVSFDISEFGKSWWRDLHSLGLAIKNLKSTEEASHFGYRGLRILGGIALLLLLFYFRTMWPF